ncbi:MAG: 16S rRNA (cytosine(1402)-N(4))-methyltransferase RsmH [Gammaproteobacteria bacterium]|nr:16S rRNA (cytosine(1402)-N(4))-methyltransferase RsmH [Gammaproteobacteria bacterium]
MNHMTVLLKEAIDELMTDLQGKYVDCTYGRGGHSAEIVSRLGIDGRLLVIDKDLEAIEHARDRFGDEPRVSVVHGSFSMLERIVTENGMGLLHGVLMDLGVSSPQLDDSARGFSFSRLGPLDMRMNQTEGDTVADWLRVAEEREIAAVIKEYGEERFAKRIARKIVTERGVRDVKTTLDLVKLIEDAIPFRDRYKHPATRSFQALRIHINNELDDLRTGLNEAVDLLARDGRLVVVSFHSLEDRIVKRFIREKEKGDPFPGKLPIKDEMLNRKLRRLGKAAKPGAEEISRNPRARSAVMRVAVKL